MPILETLVYQEDECVVRYTSSVHNLEPYINISVKKPTIKDRMVYQLPDRFFVGLTRNPPFKIACLYTDEVSAERIFNLLEDIEEKILLILEKQKDMSVEAREALHDYIERLVNYYSDQTRRITKFEGIREENKEAYDVVTINIDEVEKRKSKENDIKKKLKHFPTSPTRGRRNRGNTVNSTQSINFNSKNSPSKLKIFLVFMLTFLILGFVFAVYWCGGYSFGSCSASESK